MYQPGSIFVLDQQLWRSPLSVHTAAASRDAYAHQVDIRYTQSFEVCTSPAAQVRDEKTSQFTIFVNQYVLLS